MVYVLREWLSGRALTRPPVQRWWAAATAGTILAGILGWRYAEGVMVWLLLVFFAPGMVRIALHGSWDLLRLHWASPYALSLLSWAAATVVALWLFPSEDGWVYLVWGAVALVVVFGVALVVGGLVRIAALRDAREREEEDLRQVIVGALARQGGRVVEVHERENLVVVGPAASLAEELWAAVPEACGAQPDGEFILDAKGHVVAAQDPRVVAGTMPVCFRRRDHPDGHSWEVAPRRGDDEGPQPWPT